MIALFRAELRRLTSRRLARILALLALGITLLVLGRVFQLSHRITDTQQQVRIEQQREENLKQCREAQSRGEFPADISCDQVNYGGDPGETRLIALTALPPGIKAVGVGAAMIAFVVGASFVGAEWNAGTMQALLFWEPRRGRVLLAKGAALVTVVVAFMAALQAVVYAGLYLTAATRGSTEGVTGGFHLSNLLVVPRTAIVVAVTALIGYAVAGLARHTGAALGVAFLYFAIVENLLRSLRPGWQRYLLYENFAAVVDKRTPVAPARAQVGTSFGFDEHRYLLTGTRASITLCVYLAILIGAFYLAFTRRDVT